MQLAMLSILLEKPIARSLTYCLAYSDRIRSKKKIQIFVVTQTQQSDCHKLKHDWLNATAPHEIKPTVPNLYLYG